MTSRILLRGGLVADGIAATVRPADLLVEGRTVVRITPGIEVGPDVEVIDLTPGALVCPGFVDAHTHAEWPLLTTGRVDGALAQGVTTLVTGQDGQSWIGANARTAGYLNQYFAPVNGALSPSAGRAVSPDGGLSVAGFHEAVRGRLTQNVAVLASQGTIRHNVAALTRAPLDTGQRAAARREVEQALTDGAAGLSSGLDYLPSRFGAVDEVAALAQPLAAANRPYVSHLRSYGSGVAAGLAELIAVGQRAGIRVHASHLWGATAGIRDSFRMATRMDVPLTFDMYPYRKSSTILAMLLLPPEAQAEGPAATLAALRDPRQRRALLAGEKLTDAYLDQVYLGCLPGADAALAGLTVAGAARRAGRPPGEWVLDLLASADLNVGGHLDRPTLSGAGLAWLLDHPQFSAGSDGIYQGQHPHPRSYGTFARLAAHYLAAGVEIGGQQLARHLATNAADAYGLRGRGRLAPGQAADLCVLAPSGLIDRASYAAPARLADGVNLVLVNGTVVWRDGQPVTTAHPGQLVN